MTKPLTCPQCGGPVPLVNADSTRCPYCAAVVPVPADLRALRARDRQSAWDHVRLAAAYRQLGAPPGPWLRAWGGIGDGLFAAFWGAVNAFLRWWLDILRSLLSIFQDTHDIGTLFVMVVLPPALVAGALCAIRMALHALAPRLHADLVDVLGPAAAFALIGTAIYLLVAVPTALYHFADSFASVRHRLQAAMAARPPTRPGGPSLCRRCGAALEVPPGAYGARCDYCRCDNLVALPPEWVSAAEEVEGDQHLEVGQALQEEGEVRGAARRKLGRSLIICSLLVPGLAAGGALVCTVGLVDGQAGWSAAVADAHEAPRAAWPLWGPAPRYPPLHHDFEPAPLTRGACDLHRNRCALRYVVPLRRGELLTIETDAPRPDEFVRFAPDADPAWERGPDRSRLSFTAPYSGWFPLHLVGDVVNSYSVGWSVQAP